MSTTHKRKRNGLFYSRGEETVNSLSHGIGISMAVIIGGFFLMKCYRAQDPWAILGMWLYLFGMGGSYLSSTLYHSLKHHNPWKRRLRHWDHAAIYWHIAGSFSPVTLIALRDEGLWGWGLFCFVWLCAVAGTIISFRKMKEHSYVETVCYILMGLSVLVVFKQLFAVAPVSCYWIIAEGVCYIGGAALYSIRSVRYMHSAFHFFVLAGSGCHLVAVWYILAGIKTGSPPIHDTCTVSGLRLPCLLPASSLSRERPQGHSPRRHSRTHGDFRGCRGG